MERRREERDGWDARGKGGGGGTAAGDWDGRQRLVESASKGSLMRRSLEIYEENRHSFNGTRDTSRSVYTVRNL